MEGHKEKFLVFCNERFLGSEAAKTSKTMSTAKGARIVDFLKGLLSAWGLTLIGQLMTMEMRWGRVYPYHTTQTKDSKPYQAEEKIQESLNEKDILLERETW